MRRGAIIGQGYPGGQDPSLSWKVERIGDFDGDGYADILWRYKNGQLAIWFKGELGYASPSYQNKGSPVHVSWQVVGVGDFNHDRRDDILWRHSDGQVGIWLMNGAEFVRDLSPRWVDNAWQIKGLLHDVR